jgi:hypothetical protein
MASCAARSEGCNIPAYAFGANRHVQVDAYHCGGRAVGRLEAMTSGKRGDCLAICRLQLAVCLLKGGTLPSGSCWKAALEVT